MPRIAPTRSRHVGGGMMTLPAAAPRHRACRSAPQVSLLAPARAESGGNEEGSFVKSSVASSCCSFVTSRRPRQHHRVLACSLASRVPPRFLQYPSP
jgi:hypothetical protein